MDKKITQMQKDEIWPSLISIIAPLIQLLLVVSVSLSNILNFQKLFFYPEVLSLVNILTLFLTLSLIGLFWYWRNSGFLLFSPQPANDVKKEFVPPEKRIFSLIKILSAVSFLLFAFFAIAVVLFLTNRFVFIEIWLGSIQYLSYSFFLAFTGLVLYVWISEYTRKKQAFQREDFVRNLLNTLGQCGMVPSPDVKIWKNQVTQGWSSKTIELEIEKEKFVVTASFDGLEIFEIYKKEDYEKLLKQPLQ